MNKLLIVSTNYFPEPTGIAVYTTDLAETLKSSGYSIQVLTTLPHYPWWHTPAEFNDISVGKSNFNGIELLRVKHFIPSRMNAVLRIRFEFSLWMNLRRLVINSKDPNVDLILAVIPSVASGQVARKLSKKLKVPFGLIVQDLSGVGAKQSGLKGGIFFSKIAKLIENSVISKADLVVGVSAAISEVLRKVVKTENQVWVINNYSARKIELFDKKESRSSLGLNRETFLVIHTGNMGAKQGLENVINAAELLKKCVDIQIVIVGHGNQESYLKVRAEGMNNVQIMPTVSDLEYSKLLSSADVLLVNERSTQTHMSLPSKLTSYLFSNRPVIAAVPKDGATWKYLNGIAELVESDQPIKLAESIKELKNNKTKMEFLAKAGLEFAEANLDPIMGRKKYVDWVNALLKMKSS